MAWSTRQVAELAGITVRAVRHYHQVGLLDEPERAANGYKQYGVTHLLRVLRIKRLGEAGYSLAEIATIGNGEEEPDAALLTMDRELAATIEQLQRVRAELALTMRRPTPVDLLAEFHTDLGTISEADRALLVVLGCVFRVSVPETYAKALRGFPADTTTEFNRLPADADDDTRKLLAGRIGAAIDELCTRHPMLAAPEPTIGADSAVQAIETAIDELYNPAQIDVLARAHRLIQQAPDPRTD